MHLFRPYCLLIPLAALAALATAPAFADSGRGLPMDTPAAYRQECASCHAPYPPGMLPAASWQRIMAGLDKHYGTDASLDAAASKPLALWLQANAGTYKRVSEAPPQDRITRSAWFERKHRSLSPTVWAHAQVRSPANCAACHPQTDLGRYGDHDVRLPAGADTRPANAWRH